MQTAAAILLGRLVLRQFRPRRVFGIQLHEAGQENSFTWSAMGRGLEYQFPLIAQLRGRSDSSRNLGAVRRVVSE